MEPLKPRRTIKAMSGGSKINGKLRVLCGNPAEMRGFPCDGQVRCQLWLNSPKSGREQGGWRNVIIFYPSSIHPSLSRVPPSLPLPLPPSLTPSSSSHPPPLSPHRTKIMDHTQRELFIEQDSRGSSSPHRASLHSHQTPPCTFESARACLSGVCLSRAQ